MSDINSLPLRDARAVVHGLTNLSLHAQRGASVIQSGKGVWVQDIHGRDYIEGMSGLWCIALGYGNERLANAAHKQMLELAYYPLTNHKSHQPVIALAERLLSMAPAPMSKIWFASTGSEAIDCAARLCWYYWNAVGQPEKKKFMSHLLAYHGNTIAAFFVEPVMAAGGIIVPPAAYYEKLQRLLKKHEILLVCDEVVTAFGRTGEMFGSTTLKLQPDLLVCAKALSSAYIPISALMISPQVYEPIARQSGELGMFGLTMTYSGHPVASAVALETLNIYEELNIVAHVRQVGPSLVNGLKQLESHPLVKEVRGIGLLAGVELLASHGRECARLAEEEGLIVRAIGDTIAFCPPLIISEAEIQELLARFTKALNRL